MASLVEIRRASQSLLNCVKTDDIVGARKLLHRLERAEDRKLIVSRRNNCNAPLFVAALRGNADMVEFLVKEVQADMEEQGLYEDEELRNFYEDDETPTRHLVTPLWCAAASNQLGVVKRLIELGADINASSDTGISPVLAACMLTNIDMVKFLVEHGSDIQKPNNNGSTCLVNSVQSVELCQLIIHHGADVNAQDISGDLALHHAIYRGRQETMQLLLDHGSDPYIKNKSGDDAFQTASLEGNESMMVDLLNNFKPPVGKWIESYQLFGGYCVDYKNDIVKALDYWKKAVEMRKSDSCFTANSMKPNPVYLFVQEAKTLEELETISQNLELVYMYALMIREYILGPDHDGAIFGLLDRGHHYKLAQRFRRCIELWKYAFQLQIPRVCSLYFITNLELLGTIFWRSHQEFHQPNHEMDCEVIFEDVFDVLEMATLKFQSFGIIIKHLEKDSSEEDAQCAFMKVVLHLVNLITELDKNEEQLFSFKRIVHRLICCQPKTNRGQTLLHLSVLQTASSVNRKFFSRFPSIAVVELLLECGADVNAVDDEHNTALHVCLEDIQNFNLGCSQDTFKRIVELLLKNGAHVDIVNLSGKTAARGLLSSLMEMSVMNFVSLKCLAVRVVMKYKIPYVGLISTWLESFVQMHGIPASPTHANR